MRILQPADEIENRILDATERLLARYGFAKVTMEDIARDAGLGRRTIYLHFASKEDVALCSIDRIVQRLVERLETLAASDEKAAVRLERMLVTRVLYRFDSVRDYYQNFNDMFATLRPAYLARRGEYFDAESRVFTRVIADGQESGELAHGDAAEAALTLLVATNSLLPYSLSARELGARADVERQAASVAAMALNGLRRR